MTPICFPNPREMEHLVRTITVAEIYINTDTVCVLVKSSHLHITHTVSECIEPGNHNHVKLLGYYQFPPRLRHR
jgi:hypothetical protein